VNLSGTGLTAISLSPTSLIFGTVAVGTTSAAKTVTLTNNLGTALTIGFSASGDYAAVGSGATPCGSSLAGKAKCTMSVTFKPKSNGGITGVVTITYNSSFSPQEVALSGSGSGGPSSPLMFSRTSLTFTNQLVGTKSASETVTVTNSTALNLSISKIAASGNFAAAGSGAAPCGGSFAAGAKCTMAVSFSPSINGVIKGAVAITDSTTVSPQVYNVSGAGALPLSFSPASITFAARTVGTTSSPVTVTLTNNQSTALTISLAASGEFKAAPSGTVPCGSSLAAAAKCTFSVTFTPAAGGTINGVVTAAYTGAPYSPLEVKLTGTGQSTGDFSISALPSSLQISRGKSGGVQVTVAALNGFTGTVTVSPSSLPAGVTSAPVNITAGGTGTLTFNVSVSTANGKFGVPLKGTSGTLSHSTSVTLGIPLGGGVLNIIPRTAGSNSIPSAVAAYLASMETDVAPIRRAECGPASGSYTVEMLYDPTAGGAEFNPSPTWLGRRCLRGLPVLVLEVSRRAWGLRLRRTEQELALSRLFMLPSAHYKDVGVRIASFVGSRTGAMLRRFSLAVAPRFPLGVPH
jgi:Abnormal spindle-like microcephaly-assoc'd, ASPM-SPD-2-Hydin